MERKFIPLDLILLSDKNPRLEQSFNEEEAICNMVNDQSDKLFVLAKDIVENGLNPLDTIGVYPSEIHSGYFEVGEGNRRICALKLLDNPSILLKINARLYHKFKTLSETFITPKRIEVGIFENEKSLLPWMGNRHMGEQSGKGLSKWDSIQKARFNQIQNGNDALLDFWEWLIENNILSYDEIRNVTKTNWQRILQKRFLPFLKITYNGSYSVSPNDLDKFMERIKVIQQELSGKKVSIVYDREKIEEFFNNVSQKLYGLPYQQVIEQESNPNSSNEAPRNSSEKGESTTDSSGTNLDKTHSSDELDLSEKKSDNQQKKDVFDGCKTVIPLKYPINSSNMRLNKIINELKRLNPDKYPNACGTLLRALFELSAKVFLENQNGKDYTPTDFEQAIKNAATLLRDQKRIKNSQHSAVVKDVGNLRRIFNGYMHDTDGYPSSESIKNFFKSHKVFIEECLK